MASPSLRQDDRELLRILEEEVAARRLWTYLAGSNTKEVPAIPPRFAGLFSALGAERAEAIEAVTAGNYDGFLARLVEGASTGVLPSGAIHHVAVLFERVASLPRFVGTDRGRTLELASLRAWCRLAEKPDPLRELAERAAGEDLAKIDCDALVRELPIHALEAVAKRGLSGARERSASSRDAYQILSLFARLESNRFGLRARAAVDSILDEASAAPLEAIHEAKAQENDELAEEALRTLAAVWAWGDRPLSVETQTLEMADHFLWAWNKQDSTKPFKQRTMRALEPLIGMLASRIEKDNELFAWSALAAQSLVFLSDDLPTTAERIAAAERAVRVCPTHRNARSRLAWHRADTANSRMNVGTRDAVEEADRLLAEAERLFPTSAAVRNARTRWETAATRYGLKRTT